MHPLIVLIGLMAASNFSVIILMNREGIKHLTSWKTAAITVFVVPFCTYAVIAGATVLTRILTS